MTDTRTIAYADEPRVLGSSVTDAAGDMWTLTAPDQDDGLWTNRQCGSIRWHTLFQLGPLLAIAGWRTLADGAAPDVAAAVEAWAHHEAWRLWLNRAVRCALTGDAADREPALVIAHRDRMIATVILVTQEPDGAATGDAAVHPWILATLRAAGIDPDRIAPATPMDLEEYCPECGGLIEFGEDTETWPAGERIHARCDPDEVPS